MPDLSFVPPFKTFLRPQLPTIPLRIINRPLTCITHPLPLSDESYMRLALSQAHKAFTLNEVPIGAVLVSSTGTILSAAHNLVETTHDVTAHAEIVCIRHAMRNLQNWRLLHTTLYTTLEPCPMCLGALTLARVAGVVYATRDLRLGACGTWIAMSDMKHPFHTYERVVGGVLEDEAATLLKEFFKKRRGETDTNNSGNEGGRLG